MQKSAFVHIWPTPQCSTSSHFCTCFTFFLLFFLTYFLYICIFSNSLLSLTFALAGDLFVFFFFIIFYLFLTTTITPNPYPWFVNSHKIYLPCKNYFVQNWQLVQKWLFVHKWLRAKVTRLEAGKHFSTMYVYLLKKLFTKNKFLTLLLVHNF